MGRYVPDTTRPSLLNWDLNMNTGVLTMVFDDVMDASTLMSQFISLQSNDSSANSSYTLTSSTGSSLDGFTQVINISSVDLDAIKALRPVAVSAATSYIRFQSDLISEVASSVVNAIVGTQAKVVRTFTKDTTKPKLDSWSVNTSTGVLTLNFDETVDLRTFSPTGITLQNRQNGRTQFRTLTGGTPSVTDSAKSFTVQMIVSDLNFVKQSLGLARNLNNSYLAITDTTINDMANNTVTAIPITNALQASVHQQDVSNPRLVNYTFSLNSGILSLLFDEIINASSVQPSFFTIQRTGVVPATVADSVRLRGGTVSQTDATRITITLQESDLNSIKGKTALATSTANTFLHIAGGAVRDMRTNPILALSAGRSTTVVTADTTAPVLRSFDLDLGNNTLKLSFSESVNTTSFAMDQITLQSQKGAGGRFVNISGATIQSTSASREIVTLLLSQSVSDTVKIDPLMGTTNLNTFVSLTNSALTDLTGINVTAIPRTNALDITLLTPDTVAPLLNDYSLDMDTGFLTLTFSEAVMSSTLNTTLITLRNNNARPVAATYTLTGGTTTSGTNAIIDIRLTTTDLNAIRSNQQLATTSSDVALTFLDRMVLDTNSRAIVGISVPKLPRNFTIDSTDPKLVSYQVVMNTTASPAVLQLVLTFNEVVNVSTFNTSALTLRSAVATAAGLTSLVPTFSSTFLAQRAPSTVVRVSILNSDLLLIRARPPLFQNTTFSYLSMTAGGIVDQSNRQLVAFNDTQPTSHTADLIRPTLTSFSLNLNARRLFLTFDEAVSIASVNVSQITLQNEASTPVSQLTLSVNTAVRAVATSSSQVQLDLTAADFNSLTIVRNFSIFPNNTFISLGPVSILDLVQNAAKDIPVSAAKMAATVVSDATQPSVTSWTLDITTRIVTLTFSETISASTFDVTQLTINSQRVAQPPESLTLTGAIGTTNVDGTVFQFMLTVADQNSLKVLANLAISNTTSYLSFSTDLARDIAGNLMARRRSQEGLAVRVYVGDITPPDLIQWTIDVSRGTLRLAFNETVNVGTLNLSFFTIQDGTTTRVSNYSLVNTKYTGVNSENFTVTLNSVDSDQIKALGLCNSTLTCFVTYTSNLVNDIGGVAVVARSGFAASSLSSDSTGPTISRFTSFNLVLGELVISFNEIVRASSFNASAITLQSLFESPISMYNLTGGTVTSRDDTSVTLRLSAEDFYAVQQLENLCTHRANCYLTASNTLVNDVSGNANSPQNQGSPGLIVATFISDNQKPSLSNFTLDLNVNQLILTFSEPVRSSRLRTTAITIQSQNLSAGANFEYTLSGGTIPSVDGIRVVTVNLSSVDANELKRRSFATNTSNTYIRASSSLVTDMSVVPNSVVSISNGQTLQASLVTADTSGPTLVDFTFSTNTDQLSLTFNEPVKWSTFVVTAVSLAATNATAGGRRRTLTGGNFTDTNFSTTAVLNLAAADISFIKLEPRFATTTLDTFLNIPAGTVVDLNNNNNTAVVGKQATSLARDATRPQLQAYSLDVEAGTLNLTFTDIVNVSTFDATGITVQGSPTALSGQFATLTAGSNSSSVNGYVVVINLSAQDLLSVKSISPAARSRETTFLRMSAETIDDIDGRDVLAVTNGKARSAASFVGDTSQPRLSSFTVNMTSSSIALSFDDTVDQTKFNATLLSLQSQQVRNGSTQVLNITGGTIVRSADAKTITLTLSQADLNTLNTLHNLFTRLNNSYLTISNGTVTDLFGNLLIGEVSSNAVRAARFTSETTGPSIVNFTLNMNSGQLVLTFGESVKASTLNTTYLTLQSTSDSTRLERETYRLTGGVLNGAVDGTTLTVNLSFVDLNAIKSNRPLASSQSTTHISADAGAVRDGFDNPSRRLLPTSALQTVQYTNDTTKPRLSSFNVNLRDGTIIFTFTEDVDVNTFDPTKITILSNQDPTVGTTYQIRGGNFTQIPSTIVTLQLSKEDRDNIAFLDSLLESQNTTYIQLGADLVKDFAGELLEDVQSQRVATGGFIADDVPPTLNSFQLDMDTGILTLSFSEVVRLRDINLARARIETRTAGHRQLINASSAIGSVNNVSVQIQLHSNDLNGLKLNRNLAVSQDTTYLNLTAGFIMDMYNNSFVSLSTTLRASAFTSDTTRPRLSNYSMDSGNGRLTLTFDEPILRSSLNISGFVLQNNQTALVPSGFFRLTTTSRSPSVDGLQIIIVTSETDFNAIRDLPSLASTAVNTFLSFSNATATDMADNFVVAVSDTNALNVSFFSDDRTSPTVRNFTLNLNTGILELTFSETVNLTSFNATGLSLQSSSARGSGTESVTLGTGGIATRPSETVIRINLTQTDRDAIKAARNLATSSTNMFLVATGITVRDLAGNQLSELTTAAARGSGGFVADGTNPALISWDLDLDGGFFILSFNEAVDVPAINLSAIVIQDGVRLTSAFHIPANSSRPSRELRAVNITLSKMDFDEIRRQDLCLPTVADDCYLVIPSGAVKDLAGNNLPAIVNGAARPVAVLTNDATSPSLSSFFSIDLDSGVMELSFTEPVKATSLAVTNITLQNWHQTGPLLTNTFTLTGGSTISQNGLVIAINFTSADLNSIKIDTVLCVNPQSCWVRFPNTLIEDVSGNRINAVVNKVTFVVTEFAGSLVADTTPPNLLSYELNMDRSDFTFTFDEAIDAATIRLQQATVGNSANSTSSYTLTSTPTTPTPDGTTVRVQISDVDLLQLKANLLLATNTSSTFLTFTNFARDMSANFIVNRTNGVNALNASQVLPDVTSPTLVGFTLFDLNAEVLQLSFSEPMLTNITFSSITIQSLSNSAVISHSLLNGTNTVPSDNRQRLQFKLSAEDVRQIKLAAQLAIDAASTHVSLLAGAFQDVSGNPVIVRSNINALQVGSYIGDTTSPDLLSFNLDMDSNELSLTYNDVMDRATLEITRIRLQSTRAGSDAANAYALTTGSTSSSPNGFIIVINLSLMDQNQLKARRNLATNKSNTFISAEANTLKDVAGVNMIAITQTEGRNVTLFTADSGNPRLTAFSLSVSNSSLTLVFSETVDSATIRPEFFTLQSSRNGTGRSRTLSQNSTVSTRSPTSSLHITLTVADINFIKEFTDFGTARDNTFLSLQTSALRDMTGNAVVEIPSTNATQAATHDPDTVNPVLEFFSLDMNTNRLVVRFSETVNRTTVDQTQFVLKNSDTTADSAASGVVALRGGGVSPENSNIITINLTFADVQRIKTDRLLAISIATTYIRLLGNALSDMNGLPLLVQPARRADVFKADSTAPRLSLFDVDVSRGTIFLSFDEVVDARTLNMSVATIQSTSTGRGNFRDLLGGNTSTTEGERFTVSFLNTDLNAMKSTAGLLTSQDTTYLRLPPAFIRDMQGNPITAVPFSDARRVRNFTIDNTVPSVSGFEIDFDAGTLTLSFNEVVNGSTLNTTYITLSNRAIAGTSNFTLTGGAFSPAVSNVIVITLTRSDRESIDRLTSLGLSNTSTFLTVLASAVKDSNGNNLSATFGLGTPLFTRDGRSPSLTSFDMQMVNNTVLQIVLSFSEVVDITTLNLTKFTLSTPSGIQAHTLTGGSFDLVNSSTVTVNVSAADLRSIRGLLPLGTNSSQSLLSITADGVRDMSGNRITVLTNQPATTHTADLVPPALQSFSLDYNMGELRFTFNEPIRPNTFQPLRVRLQHAANTSATNGFHNLTGGTPQALAGNTAVVVLTLTQADLDVIHRKTSLATRQSNTYVAFSQRAVVLDIAENEASVITIDRAVQAADFTADGVRPQLVGFDINIAAGTVTLSFSETMQIATFRPAAGITLQSNPTGVSAVSHELRGGSPITTINTTDILFNLTEADHNAILQIAGLAVSLNTSYIAIEGGVIQDMSNNDVQRIATSNAIRASFFFNDTSGPTLLSASFAGSSSTLTLTFSETVNASTLRAETLTFLASASSAVRVNLSLSSIASTSNSETITIQLSSADSNRIKLAETLCTVTSNCFVSFPATFVRDMSLLPVFARPLTNPAAVTYTVDSEAPRLTSFHSINLINGQLVLNFSEAVNASSFNALAITLQDFFESPASTVTLTGGSVGTVDSSTLTLQLTDSDLSRLKTDVLVCASRTTCYITFSRDLVQDMTKVRNTAQLNGSPGIVVRQYTKDTVAPQLVQFDLDLNGVGVLTIYFSEPVQRSTLRLPSIFLQDGAVNVTQRYGLTGGNSSSFNTSTLQVVLSSADLNALQGANFSTQRNNTYLTVRAAAIQDTAGVGINAVADANALNVVSFTPDNTLPRLTDFQLDLGSDRLVLTFSEPVNPFTLQIPFITILASNRTNAPSYNLTNGTVLTRTQARVITLSLTERDITAIKTNTGLATNASNTYLSLLVDTIRDAAGKSIAAVAARPSSQAHLTDTSRPTLRFFSIDMHNSVLNLTFSDVVRASSLRGSAIGIQDGQTATAGRSVRLSDASRTSSSDGYTLVVNIAVSDLLTIKSVRNMATTINNTWITLQAFGVDDVYGADVLAVTDGNAIRATGFLADTFAPVLNRFVLDMDGDVTLRLTFSDTMDAASLTLGAITIQNSASPTQNVTLTGGTPVRGTDGTSFNITLNAADANNLKLNTLLANNSRTAFVNLQSGTLKDLAGNNLTAVVRVVDQFIPDTTAPEIVRWQLNMNTGHLILTLSEAVQANSLNVTGIGLQPRIGTEFLEERHFLTGFNATTQQNGITISINLTATDLNAIKAISSLATSFTNTYIVAQTFVLRDMNNQFLRAIPTTQGKAILSADFTVDTTMPSIVGAVVDMNTAQLRLTFDEAIDASRTVATEITLTAGASSGNLRVLRGGARSSRDGVNINITLAKTDLDALQLNRAMFTSLSNSFLSFTNASFFDMIGLRVVARTLAMPFQATDFIPDTKVPTLVQWTMDMNGASPNIVLSFSEVVDPLTLDVTRITISGNSSTNGPQHTLTTSVSASISGLTVHINMSEADANAIKSNDNVASSAATSFLYFNAVGAVADMVLNNASAMTTAVQVADSGYTNDITEPLLRNFTLDVNASQLVLTFDESIRVTTLNFNLMSLQSDATTSPAARVNLRNGVSSSSSPNQPIITIDLGKAVLDRLQSLTTLGTNRLNTFLALDNNAAQDMRANRLVSVTLAAGRVLDDMVTPVLSGFTLSLVDNGVLILSFSEYMNVSSLDMSQLTLQQRANGGQSVRLGGLSSRVENGITINVTLNLVDVNRLKQALNVATQRDNTYASFPAAFISDMAGNAIQARPTTTALRADNFIIDATDPIMANFSLNLGTGIFNLSFTETVNASSLQVTQISFVNSSTVAQSGSFLLRNGTFSLTDSNVIQITLAKQDRDELYRLPICTQQADCHISFPRTMVSDVFGRQIVEVSQLQVAQFFNDTVRPTLVQFPLFNLSSGTFELVFSEPVRVSTLNFTMLTLQQLTTPSSPERITLTGGSTTSPDGTRVVVQLTKEDLDRVKLEEQLCTVGLFCNIQLTAAFVQDMAGNAIQVRIIGTTKDNIK